VGKTAETGTFLGQASLGNHGLSVPQRVLKLMSSPGLLGLDQ
jgi:hypothetical protein